MANQLIRLGTDIESHISVSNPQVTEGDSGTTNAVVVVSTDQVFNFDVIFQYETKQKTSGSVATEGVDYQAVSGEEVLLAGQSSVSINIPIIGDLIEEPDELFDLRTFNFRRVL